MKAVAIALTGFAAAVFFLSVLPAQTQQKVPPARSVRDGVYTEVQVDRAHLLYEEYCDRCHGDDLEGEEAPALYGDAFLKDWSGLTVADLFDRIHLSMPGNHPGILTAEQTADLVALILHANQFPAGKTALPTGKQALLQIRLEAK